MSIIEIQDTHLMVDFFLCSLKRFYVVPFISLFLGNATAQETFIKIINTPDSSSRIRVLPTSDKGWVIFSLDSLKLYKFNRCGVNEWSKKYFLPTTYYTQLDYFIKTQFGGFAILTQIKLNPNVQVPLLTTLDSTGNILWSKSYENLSYNHYPYTISQDSEGNFFIFGNISPVGGGNTYYMICKIDTNGNIIWTKLYPGGTWGGALVTSDNGVLARMGPRFFKTDSVGNVQWSTYFVPNNQNYFAPVEVMDGYIFNLSDNNAFGFCKMDKQGNLLLGGRKTFDCVIPPSLRKKNNGNLAGVFRKGNYPTVIEFDKDLNIVIQSSINYSQPGVSLWGIDICFLDDSTTIMAGKTTIDTVANLFFVKTDKQFRTGCDTILSVNISTDSVKQSFLSTNVITYNMNVVERNYIVESFSASQSTLCRIPKNLNIGNDTILCSDTTVILQNITNDFFDDYYWSNGETTSSISVNEPGIYHLLVTYNCGADSISDTVILSKVNFPIPFIISDTSICNNKPVLLDAEISNAAYRWQDGSTYPKYWAFKPGDYFVDITFSQCTKRFNTHIPPCERLSNVFTPNGDGQNDVFQLFQFGSKSIQGKIFNRWGELIYAWSNTQNGWDGTIQNAGKEASEGVYFYIIDLVDYNNDIKLYSGFIFLIR